MQAEDAFLQALKAEASDEEKSMLSTIDIQSNLLLIYYVQNDQEKAYPLLDEMYRLTEEEEEQQTIKEETIDRMDALAVALQMQRMEQADPEFIAGNQITLKGNQAERFVRYRDMTQDHSALYRIFRGQEYMTGFFKSVQSMSKTDSQTVPRLFGMIEDYMITDMEKDQYLGIAADALTGELTSEDFYVLPGRAVVTETYDEYHADEKGMTEVLLNLFYRES